MNSILNDKDVAPSISTDANVPWVQREALATETLLNLRKSPPQEKETQPQQSSTELQSIWPKHRPAFPPAVEFPYPPAYTQKQPEHRDYYGRPGVHPREFSRVPPPPPLAHHYGPYPQRHSLPQHMHPITQSAPSPYRRSSMYSDPRYERMDIANTMSTMREDPYSMYRHPPAIHTPSLHPMHPLNLLRKRSRGEDVIDLDDEEESSPVGSPIGSPTQPSSPKSAFALKIKPKKRRRRRDEVERKFACPCKGCTKTYGTEGALKTHIKIKHNEDPVASQMQNPEFVWPAQVFLKQTREPGVVSEDDASS